MMHAAGIYHEHTRPDRDNFVTIQEGNIRNGAAGNFEKGTESEQDTRGIPYDYLSVMHYGRSVSIPICDL